MLIYCPVGQYLNRGCVKMRNQLEVGTTLPCRPHARNERKILYNYLNISVLRTLRTIQEYRPYLLFFLHCTLPKRILTHPRHFYPVSFVKQYIYWMALHKMNVFPRLAALAEKAWCGERLPGWNDFEPRLLRLLNYYDLWRIRYNPAFERTTPIPRER